MSWTARHDARWMFTVLRSPIHDVVDPCPCSHASCIPCSTKAPSCGQHADMHDTSQPGPRDDDRASDVVPTTRCSWWTT
ncbi:uncharacterized protein [Zea mays]|uniref:uncharacterized protein n=1 Tax=Zea mays TaxID=4577 RepID=UPI0004DE920A|nr:uncharacterized protein LOC103653319 [Zea mays]|eukprot:XP_008678474.1 uncharacterized protein LOC103653319 [Zea mays]